jgi:hypothetical protein
LNHHCDITSGVLQNECSVILQDFFRKRRHQQAGTPARSTNRRSEIGN